METKVGVKGQYKALVINQDGSLEKETDWGDNMLLDSFFAKMTSNPTSFGSHTAKVGRSAIPVAPTQTGLQDYITTTDPSNTGTLNPDIVTNGTTWSGYWEATYTFAVGQIVDTVREIGWNRNKQTGAFVDSRIVLSEEITLDATQQLVIKFRLSISGSDIPREGTCVIDGQTYNWYACRYTEKNSLDWILAYDFANFIRLTDRATGFRGIGEDYYAAESGSVSYSFITTGIPAGTVRQRLYASISQANMQIDVVQLNVRVKMLLTPPLIKNSEMTLELLFDTVYTRA